ncbi:MAG: PAS domain-containing protein, partial [Solirubrobacteraceae bacterium]
DPAVLFRRVFDQRFQFMAVLDPSGIVLEVNGAPERRGLARSEFIGLHLASTPNFRSDPNWLPTWNARLAEAAELRDAVAYEDVFTGPRGETRSADAVVTPVFTDEHHLEYFIVEAEDTTERIQVELALRESERRFHDFAESLPVMAWSTDATGSCDYLNRRWLDYTGAAPGQHHGWSWLDALHPEDRPKFADVWMAAIADGSPATCEYRVRRYDGEYRWFDLRVVPVLGHEEQVTRWYGTAADIHDAHELRASLAEREAQLSAALVAGSMARFAYDLESRRFTSDPFLSELIQLPQDYLPRTGIEGWSEMVHPDDRAEWQQEMARSFNPATPDFSVTYRLLGSGPRPQWIGSRGRVEFDDKGKPRKIAGIVFALPGAGGVDPRD